MRLHNTCDAYVWNICAVYRYANEILREREWELERESIVQWCFLLRISKSKRGKCETSSQMKFQSNYLSILFLYYMWVCVRVSWRGMVGLDYFRIFSERTKKTKFPGKQKCLANFPTNLCKYGPSIHILYPVSISNQPFIHGICAWIPKKRYDMLRRKIPAAHSSSFPFFINKKSLNGFLFVIVIAAVVVVRII